MFDFAWSELALIGVVALVVIGPKDLPEAVRGLARGIQKLRRMAGEFQRHADDLVKEANLEEVRQQINELRSFNLKDTIERAVDDDGTIRRTFTEDPLRPASASGVYGGTAGTTAPAGTEPAPPAAAASSAPPVEGAPGGLAAADAAPPPPAAPPPASPDAPAFIPPDVAASAPTHKA